MLGIVQKRRQINNANDVHQSVYFILFKTARNCLKGVRNDN